MKRLYQRLIDGYDKGAALRQAKVDLLKESVIKRLQFIGRVLRWSAMAPALL